MRITLLRLPAGGRIQAHRDGVGHLGLAYIAAVLLQEGHEVAVLDARNTALSDEDLVNHLRAFDPQVFGVTAMTHEIHAAAEACRVAKTTCPDLLTVAGGPHTSALPERTLEEFPSIDIAAVGEGERTMSELVGAIGCSDRTASFRQIRGIAFRNGMRVVRTAERPWNQDLDGLPLPAWHLFPKVFWPVFASRGCPYGCVFCQRVMGRRLRLRSVGNVIAELDALEERCGQRAAWFQDETFGANPQWTREFLAAMKERNRTRGYQFTWGGNSRVNLADDALYREMREAGCRDLSFGVESGSDVILKRIKKAITRDGAVRAIASARRAGIRTAAFFIIGHPGETWRTALATVHLAAVCRANSIAVGIMVPYPGTEVWSMARSGQYNYRLLSEDWRHYDKYFGNALEIRGLNRRQLEFLQALAYVWHFVYNFKVRGLLAFVLKFRREIVVTAKRLLDARA